LPKLSMHRVFSAASLRGRWAEETCEPLEPCQKRECSAQTAPPASTSVSTQPGPTEAPLRRLRSHLDQFGDHPVDRGGRRHGAWELSSMY
jgi:hypothetical protein